MLGLLQGTIKPASVKRGLGIPVAARSYLHTVTLWDTSACVELAEGGGKWGGDVSRR